jgi:hypothetical protein
MKATTTLPGTTGASQATALEQQQQDGLGYRLQQQQQQQGPY